MANHQRLPHGQGCLAAAVMAKRYGDGNGDPALGALVQLPAEFEDNCFANIEKFGMAA